MTSGICPDSLAVVRSVLAPARDSRGRFSTWPVSLATHAARLRFLTWLQAQGQPRNGPPPREVFMYYMNII
ncbi:hypothetical protein MASR2M74_31760 [Paracoccaceae bacterium]